MKNTTKTTEPATGKYSYIAASQAGSEARQADRNNQTKRIKAMKIYIIEYRTTKANYWKVWVRKLAESPKKALIGADLAICAFLDTVRIQDKAGLKIRARAYKPTIGDIADNCGQSPYFDRDTMKYFGQTRASFKVYPTKDPYIFQTVGTNPRTKNQSIAYWTFTGTDKRTLATCWKQCSDPVETPVQREEPLIF